MNRKTAAVLASLLALGGVTLAATQPSLTETFHEQLGFAGDGASDAHASEGADSNSDASQDAQAEAPDPSSSTSSSEASSLNPQDDPPLVRSAMPGSSPLDMTEDLLGPTPEHMPGVDPDQSLEHALRQHPSFPDDKPVQTDGIPSQGPVENALSRLVQAHAIMTEIQTAASEGDPVAKEMLPHAAAQLADEAERTAPTFEAASDLYTQQAEAQLRVNGEPVPVEEVASYQEEVDRLYSLIGLPQARVDAGAHDPTELARIVHATADVVEATQDAQRAAERAETIQGDLDRVDAALQDGALTQEDADLIVEVATLVHEVTIEPLQQRLDALDTLHATTQALGPSLATTAGDTSIQNTAVPTSAHDPATVDEILGLVGDDPEQTAENLQDALEDGAEDAEETADDAQEDAEETADDTEEQAEETIQPVNDELANNFADPFGAIVILGEDDDQVDGTGSPVPVNVPGVGSVGSLFPRAPLLVVDRGGDDTYQEIPRSTAVDETLQGTGEPLVPEEDIRDELPLDPRQPAPSLPGLFFGIESLVNALTAFTYDTATEPATDQQGVEVALAADTPVQVVVDLDGDDTYNGSVGAAYAAGGGTAAVYDDAGNDTYDVDKGVGLLEEDGLALVKDYAGDDTIRAQRGVGSVVHPFTLDRLDEPDFDDDIRYQIGGLGGYVNFDGDNTYEVDQVGIGVGFQQISALYPGYPSNFGAFNTERHVPLDNTGTPLALDLGGEATGFQPVILDEEPEPTGAVEQDEGGEARAWIHNRIGEEPSSFFSPFDQGFSVPSQTDPVVRKVTAAHRTYEVGLSEATEGTLHVDDHNVTYQPSDSSYWYQFLVGSFGDGAIDLNNEVLVHLDDEARVYEPPHPVILVDAGDSDDVYRNVTPPGMVAEQDVNTQNTLFFVSSNLVEDDVTFAPNLVLDTRGNDRYENGTAHLNTTRVAEELDSDNPGTTEWVRAPAAGSVVADLGGDDTFEDDVASVDVNMTLYASTMTSLVYSAGGSDTVTGGQVGGINVSHALAGTGLGDQEIGHTITSLLLMGSQDPDTEQNNITAREGSLGSVFVQEPGPDQEAVVHPTSTFTAASTVAGPANFESPHHSFGSVRWCDTGERCPDSGETIVPPTDGDRPEIRALFVAGNTPNTYTLESPEAIGHVTIDPEANLCTSVETLFDNRVSENPPSILTRFVETGGSTVYEMTDRTEEVPPWRNDHSWRPFDPPEDEECPETQIGHQQTGHVSPSDTPVGDALTVQTVDTLAIDNLAQFVVGSAGESVGSEAEDQTGLSLGPPSLCAGPFAVAEDDPTLLGFDQPSHRCVDESNKRTLSQDPLGAHERFLVTTELRGAGPANSLAPSNLCDTGQGGDRTLELDAREENVPDGNPLAHGTSGCWATLELKKKTASSSTAPEWRPLAPDGEGWLNVMAAELQCGETDDRSSPIKCATDAFPVPYHVDGSDGHNLERWFLAEGEYDYRVTLHGPLSMIKGEDAVIEGQLVLDRDPLSTEQPVPGYEEPVETREKPGLLTWLEDADADTVEGALEGFDVRVVHQDSAGEPEQIEVWSPLLLTEYRSIVPVACVDETPYRGSIADASTEWRSDRGHWVTTYDLELWEDEPLPEECPGQASPATLEETGEPIAVDTGLWHVPFGETPERIDLPSEATTNTTRVDGTEPEVTLTPLPGPNGSALEQLDASNTGTVGIGIEDLSAPRVDGAMTPDDLTDGPLYIQLALNVTSHSPMQELEFAGETDNPLAENVIHVPDDVEGGIELTYDHDEQTGAFPCSPESVPDGDEVACQARLNLTSAGQARDGTWYRHANLNLTLHPEQADEDAEEGEQSSRVELLEALERSTRQDEELLFEVVQDGNVEVEDEAGNELSRQLNEIVLDLSRPSNLAFPCQGEGLEVATAQDTIKVRSFSDNDDLLGLLVEARQGDNWTVQEWIWEGDLESVNGACEADSGGQWSAFDYTIQAAEENETVRQELRTVPVDHAGNRALSFGPFEFAVTVDQEAPTIRLDQHAATPSSVTVNVTADEPVTLNPDVALKAPDGSLHEPLFVADDPDTEHQLVFPSLEVNTTYELSVLGVDEAGNEAGATASVDTARTLNVSLESRPEVVGDAVELAFTAGALAPDEQGDPMTRLEATALSEGTECASPRSMIQYIDAPVDDPRTYTVQLPLTDCPGGELTLTLTVENGPEDDPLEQVTLTTDALRDTEVPTPDVDVDGDKAETGWYTSPVSITPTGEDDTGIQKARIQTPEGPVSQLTVDEPGVHELTVTAVDRANRSATDTVAVPVDLAPPDAHLVSQDPLPTERTFITVQVVGTDDASGLDAIRTLDADGSFTEWSPVVEGMQLQLDIDGLDTVVAEVRDRAGHITQTVLPVTSLANPPTVEEGHLVEVSPASIEVHAVLDRPLELEAVAEQDGHLVSTATSPQAEEHRFTIDRLTPATETSVTVRAQLSDGSTVPLEEVSGTVQLPASQGPPTVPENLSAEVLTDGTVKVSWDAAKDDAGIDRYLIERRTDGQLSDQRSVTDTRILDDPEAGATHEYRVQAVDLAGRTGGWTNPVAVTSQAPLEVVSYEIEPEIAPAGTPVEITVVAEGDEAPGTASVSLGDERIPLALEEGEDGRWVYSATVDLPATDTFFPEGITVHMDDTTFPEEGSYPGPVVKALEDDEISTTEDVPAPGVLALLTVLTLIPVARRWTA